MLSKTIPESSRLAHQESPKQFNEIALTCNFVESIDKYPRLSMILTSILARDVVLIVGSSYILLLTNERVYRKNITDFKSDPKLSISLNLVK